MTWFRVDDGLHSHPKWLGVSSAARGVWVTAGSWCAAHLTDGHVPRHVLPVLGGRPRDAAELVAAGLWTVDGDGWRFHDWGVLQPSSTQVRADRDAAAERQRRARDRARESQRVTRDASRDSHAVTRHADVTPVTVPPTRPVRRTPPTPPDPAVRPPVPDASTVMAHALPDPGDIAPPPAALRSLGREAS